MTCKHSVVNCPCCFKRELQRMLPGAIKFYTGSDGKPVLIVADLETCIEAFFQATGIDVRQQIDKNPSESSE